MTESSSSVLIGEFACIDLKFKLNFQIQSKKFILSDFNLTHHNVYYFADNIHPSYYVMLKLTQQRFPTVSTL